jgi:hypothetical protein
MQTDSDRTDHSKKDFALVPKQHLHKMIWVEDWQPESITKIPGWPEYFERTKTMAEPRIQILQDPTVGPGEAQQLAA